MDINHMKYTWAHKKAYLQVEKQLIGKNTLTGLLHDMDKMFLYLFLDGKKVSKLHRKYSKHHTKAKTKWDYTCMIIDWECARITKPDKPLTASQALYKLFPELEYIILPILKEFKLV